MWMAAFWDPMAGDYSANQDWFPAEDNGSVWEADLMGKGRLCFDGLTAMRAWMLQPKSSVPSPALSPTDELKNFMLAFMSAWCKRVRDGIMAHGPLLAHAVQCGDCLARTTNVEIDGSTSDFLVPKKRHEAWSNYSWQQHGADGLAGITKFLQLNGFWSAPVMPITHLKTPAPAQTLMQINKQKLADTVPKAVWQNFHPPRGVEVYIFNETYQNQYQWSIKAGVPDEVEQCFRRPASCVNHIPGGSEVTYYMQSKGHWFWAFFPHEGTGNLEVKWIRGRIPTGKQQWRADYAADISMGVGHINDFRFVHGLYLEDAGTSFPIFLYMERNPHHGKQQEQLHLLACSRVPPAVQLTVHPASFSVRRGIAGWVQDPGRRHMMWQEAENGPITFQAGELVFYQDA